jgi:hypothetical protein
MIAGISMLLHSQITITYTCISLNIGMSKSFEEKLGFKENCPSYFKTFVW